MTLKNLVLILFTILLFGSCVDKGVKYYRKGMGHFEAAEYEFAAEALKQGLAYGAPKAKSNYFIAESYRLSNRIALSEDYYKSAIESGIRDEHAAYYYAYSLKANGKYESEKAQLKRYLRYGTNFGYITQAKNEIKNIEELAEIAYHKQFYKVKNCTAMNSEDIDYSPMVYRGNTLYFTSSRGEGPLFKGQGTRFTDLYEYRLNGDDEDFSGTIYPLPEHINQGRTHEATMTFSPDGGTMIFARSGNGKKKGVTKEVDLFSSVLVNGQWGEPTRLDISESGSWDSNPFWSQDGQYLYFSSNREGGFGGLDIWKASLDSLGQWSNPKNLGPRVNTPGNEQFPFKAVSGELYFSSDGHPSFGGLDLFVYKKMADNTVGVKNLGRPINSGADDFGISFITDSSGFFASNRVGGLGDDDIYYFGFDHGIDYYLEGVVTGKLIDKKNIPTGEEIVLSHSYVQISDELGKLLGQMETDSIGRFKFSIEPEKNYTLKAKHEGYIAKEQLFSTLGKTVPKSILKDLEEDIVLQTEIELLPIGKDIVVNFPPIRYDYNSWVIRTDATLILNQMAKVMKDNPEILVELGSHTDAQGSMGFNDQLSQKRAESAVAYIISQGVESSRITAKGYGERVPLTLTSDTLGFTSGLVLSDTAIAKLPKENQDLMNSLNRRTEFKIVGYLNTKSLDEIEIIRNDEEEGVKEEVKIKNEKEIIRKQIREKEKLQDKEIIKQD